jgi:hypothetical protein
MALRDGGGAAVLKRKMRGFSEAVIKSHCGTLPSDTKADAVSGFTFPHFCANFFESRTLAMKCAYST